MAISYMTKEGYQKLVEEIKYLETVSRPEIRQAIAEARDKGDLSENAEYDAAKEAQGLLEIKIGEKKTLLASARIIDESKLSTDSVQVLSKVKIRNQKTKAVMEYTLVSEAEADLRQGKLSVTSPVGKGLLNKKIGEVAQVQTPAGLIPFEILEISL